MPLEYRIDITATGEIAFDYSLRSFPESPDLDWLYRVVDGLIAKSFPDVDINEEFAAINKNTKAIYDFKNIRQHSYLKSKFYYDLGHSKIKGKILIGGEAK